jgi:hypothetical protein
MARDEAAAIKFIKRRTESSHQPFQRRERDDTQISKDEGNPKINSVRAAVHSHLN